MKKKTWQRVLTLFLVMVLAFGIASPTVAYAASGESEPNGADREEVGGTVDLDWFLLEYDEDSLTLTLYQEIKSILATDKADIELLFNELMNALKLIAIEDIEKEYVDGQYGDLDDGYTGSGINMTNVWHSSIDRYIDSLPNSIIPDGDTEPYITFFKAAVKTGSEAVMVDGKPLMSDFIDYACSLVKLAYKGGYITYDELTVHNGEKIAEKIDEIIAEKIDAQLMAKAESYAKSYVSWILGDTDTLNIEDAVRNLIDAKVRAYAIDIRDKYIAGTLSAEKADEVVFKEYADAKVAAARDEIIKEKIIEYLVGTELFTENEALDKYEENKDRIYGILEGDGSFDGLNDDAVNDAIRDKITEATAVDYVHEMLLYYHNDAEKQDKYLIVKDAIEARVYELTHGIDMSLPPVDGDIRDEAFIISLGIGHRAFNAKVDEYVSELIADYEVLLTELEDIDKTLEFKELLEFLTSITVNGKTVYGPGENGNKNYIDMEGLKAVLSELPTFSELRNYTLAEMSRSFEVEIFSTVGDSKFTFTVKVGSGDDKVRKIAALIDDYVSYSLDGTTLNLAVRLPERTANLLLDACNSDKIEDALKLRIFSLLDGSFGDAYNELRSFTFDEIRDILTANYDFVRNSDFVNSVFDAKNLSDNEIDRQLDKLEPYFNTLMSYLDRAYGYVPDEIKTKSLADMYAAGGKFTASASKLITLDDIETALLKINEKLGNFIPGQLPEFEKTLTVNAELSVPNVYKVTYVTPDGGERVGFLPVGADVGFFADMEEFEGQRIEAWAENGAVINSMPARDVVLTPVLEVLLPDEIVWDYDASNPFIYDGNDKEVKLLTVLDETRVTVVYSGTYKTNALGDSHTATVTIYDKYGKKLYEDTLVWQIILPTETVTWDTDRFITYDAQEHEPKLLGIDLAKYDVAYSGDVIGKDADFYETTATVTFKNGGQLLGTYTLKWRIEARNISLSWSGRYYEYDGSSQGPVLVGFPDGVPAEWTVEYVNDGTYVPSAVNAGSYQTKAVITLTTSNYKIDNLVRTLDWKILEYDIDVNRIHYYSLGVSTDSITAPLTNYPRLSGVDLHQDRDKFIVEYFKDAECTVSADEGFDTYGVHMVYARITIKDEYKPNYQLGTSGDNDVKIFNAEFEIKTKERIEYNQQSGKLDVKVNVSDADAGHIPNDVHIKSEEVSFDATNNLLDSADGTKKVDILAARDVYFYQGDNTDNKYNLQGREFLVTIRLEGYTSREGLYIVYVNDSGAIEAGTYDIVLTSVQDGDLYITFKTTHFSTYAVAKDYVAPTVPQGLTWTADNFVVDGTSHSVYLDWNYDSDVFTVKYVNGGAYTNTASAIGDYVARVEICDKRNADAHLAFIDHHWCITPEPYTPPTVSWTEGTLYFDGLIKSVSVILPEGVELVSCTNNVKFDVGVYTAVAILRDTVEDHLFESRFTWSIVKPEVSFEWDYTAPFTYNGAEQGIYLGSNDDRFYVTYNGNVAQNAGTYVATATVKYKVSGAVYDTYTKTWQINPYTLNLSELTWDYTPGTTNYVYAPGSEYSVNILGLPAHFPTSLVKAKTGEGYALRASDAGTYTAGIVIGSNSNYVLVGNAPADIEWRVAPFELDLSLVAWDYTADTKFVYAPGTTYSVKIVGLPEGFPESLVVYNTAEGYAITANKAGVYKAGVTINVNSNYVVKAETFAPADLTWTVEKATIDLSGVILPSLTVVADGKAHTLELTGLTDEMLALLDVTYTGNTASAPGIYKVVVTFTPKDAENYKTPDARVAYIYLKASSYKYPEDAIADYKVEVSLGGANAFDAGITFGVEEKTEGFASGITYKDTEGNDVKYNVLVAYDINFLKDGALTSLNGNNVQVKIRIPETHLSRAALAIAYVKDDGTVELIDSERDGSYLVFNTNHFSVYAVVAPVSTAPVDDTEEFDILPIIIAAIALLLIILIIVIIIIIKKKGKNGGEPTEPAVEEPEEPTPPEVPEAPIVEEPVSEPKHEETVAIKLESAGDDSLKAVINGEVVMIRYRSSFMSRLIQAEPDIQSYYSILKNKLMSFEDVKARTSWNFESFNSARLQLAKLNVKGKALQLYLALDTEAYNVNKYHFQNVGDKPKFADVPMLLKVKSERGLKYALELIDELMRINGISALEEADKQDYSMPYETTEALAARGLVKIILPKGMKLSDDAQFVKVDVSELLSSSDASVAEEPKAEEVTAEAPVEEAPVEEPIAEEVTVEEAHDTEKVVAFSLASAGNDSLAAIIDGEAVPVRYRSSFMSRLIQSGEDIQSYYTAIKNKLLSHSRVKARTSWNFESFNSARLQLAKLNVKGKALLLYLNLDTEKYNANKYHFKNVGDQPKFSDVTMMLKVKSERALKYALELIDELMSTYEISRLKSEHNEDYRMPYESTEVLAERGLVKIILPKGVTFVDGMNTVKVDLNTFFAAKGENTPPFAKKAEADE